MIEEKINNLQVIDSLIRQKKPFAVFRIPGEKFPRITPPEVTIRIFHDLKDLNKQRGFAIAPFHVSEKQPIVLIQPVGSGLPMTMDIDAVVEKKLYEETKCKKTFPSTCTDQYAAHFNTFINALREKTFDKLVLSRELAINRMPDISIPSIFSAACKQYIHSYIYLCYTPYTGMWLGCTPEIILSGDTEGWNTAALAGTQPLHDGRLPQTWDTKNKTEQEYVTAYIRRQLISFGIRFTENGPYPVYAGALSHLKTDFRFSLSDNTILGDLLKILHPTPAVCGLPKEEAYRFIMENEGYDRRYYSGFIGWIDPDGRTDLYVNLRCMHIDNEHLTLYAGGGLLASSELDDEWTETEKKMQTMRRLLRAPKFS